MVSVEGTSARAWVGVSAPVAPQLVNTALPHLTPASPRRLGAIHSRTVAVLGSYRQRPNLLSDRGYGANQLTVSVVAETLAADLKSVQCRFESDRGHGTAW
jgi:hypothetical protein